VAQTSFGEAYTRSSVVAVSMQSTGKLVAAGSVGSFAGGGSLVGLARYLP
jgi:hypothetical protein